ncbi:MAG: hypothetical protein CSA35_08465 [Dethiosulfovibrio peptidovorans]|nr:MAG: hypothetical protein CSA35_08465 [Dethiosulfovibrio peptidovorans]
MATITLRIVDIQGEVIVRAVDGSVRQLKIGDVLDEGELIITRSGRVLVEDTQGQAQWIEANQVVLVASETPEELNDLILAEQQLAEGNPEFPQDGPSIRGHGFVKLPKMNSLYALNLSDPDNIGRDENTLLQLTGRHTVNPRIGYDYTVNPPYHDALRVDEPRRPDVDMRSPEPWPPENRLPDYEPDTPSYDRPEPVNPPEPPTPDIDTDTGDDTPAPDSKPGGGGYFGGGSSGGSDPTPPPPAPTIGVAPDTDHVSPGAPDEGADDGDPNTSVILGNVTGNDTPAEAGNTIDVIGVAAGATGANADTGVGTQITGDYGTVTINADGSYTYVLDNANPDVSSLPSDGTLNDVFTYTVTDESGEIKHTTLTINITGENQPPQANPDTNAVGEDGPPVTGTLIPNDTDPEGDGLTVVGIEAGDTGVDNTGGIGTVIGTYGTVTVNPDGTYTYTPNDAAEKLAAGESDTDVFTYTISDGQGGTSHTTLTITVTGTNDGVTILPGGDTGIVTEFAWDDPLEGTGAHASSGTLEFTDADLSDAHTITTVPAASGYLGNFVPVVNQITNEVEWQFTVNDAELNHLKEGETLTQVYTVTVDDGHGGTSSKDVTVTIHGANEAPEALADSIVTTSGTAEGNVLNNDSDIDGAHEDLTVTRFTVDGMGGTFFPGGTLDVKEGADTIGTLSISPDGSYTFTAAHNYHGTVPNINYTIQDEHGAEDTAILKISVPDINAPLLDLNSPASASDPDTAWAASYTEDGSPVSIADVDMGINTNGGGGIEKATITLTNPQVGDLLDTSGIPAGFDVSVSGNTITITVSGGGTLPVGDFQEAIKAITFETDSDNPNTDVDRIIEVQVEDSNSASNVAISTITVAAANDAPTIDVGNDTGTVIEAGHLDDGVTVVPGTASVSGNLNATDPDNGDTQTWSIQGSTAGTYGAITIDPGTGAWEYILNNENSATQALKEGETRTETFTAVVTDSAGATDTQEVTITVHGTNDAPQVTSGVDAREGNVREDGTQVATGTLTSSDVDVDTSAANHGSTWSLDTTSGTYGDITIDPDTGQWTYTLDNDSSAVQGLRTGETRTETFTATITDDKGAIATETITVRVAGRDDAPVVRPDTDAVTEDVKLSTTGNVITGSDASSADTDVDAGATLAVSGIALGTVPSTAQNVPGGTNSGSGTVVNGTYGTLSIGADGSYSYTLNNASDAVQNIAKGEVPQEIFTYTVTDDDGIARSTTLTIDVSGRNDQPEITVSTGDTDSAAHDETSDEISLSGTLSVSDADISDTVSINIENVSTNASAILDGEGYPGGLTEGQFNDMLQSMLTFASSQVIDGSSTEGAHAIEWEFNTTTGGSTVPFDFVPAGEDLVITYTVKATDSSGQGDTVSNGNEVDNDIHTITITIHGTNDQGVLAEAIVTSDFEDIAQTGNVFDAATPDPDAGEELAVTKYTIDGMGGEFTPHDSTPVSVTNSDGNTIGTLLFKADGSYIFTPTGNYSGPVPEVTYTATSGPNELGSSTLTLSVKPVADAPNVTVAEVETPEDTDRVLGLNAPVVNDTTDQSTDAHTDNPERIGAITLTIPEGVTLKDGSGNILVTGGSGGTDYSIVISDRPHVTGATGDATMTVAEYEALVVAPPTDSHENFSMGVSVTSYEVDDNGNVMKVNEHGLYDAGGTPVPGATTNQTIDVDVTAVTDAVKLEITEDGSTYEDAQNEGDAVTFAVSEDSEFDLSSTLKATYGDGSGSAGDGDTDGSERRWITVKVPGSEAAGDPALIINGTEYKAGVTFTAPYNAPGNNLSTDEAGFPDIKIKAEPNFSGEIKGVEVVLHAQDTDGDSTVTTTEETDPVFLNFTVNPVAGDVTTVVNAEATEDQGREFTDTATQTNLAAEGITSGLKFLDGLDVTDTSPNANNGGEETLVSITLKGSDIPGGWRIFDPAGNDVTPPSGGELDIDTGAYKNYIALPPAHSSHDVSFPVSVVTRDTVNIGGNPVTVTNDGQGTNAAPTEVTVNIAVTPVAEFIGEDSDGDGSGDLSMVGNKVYSTPAYEDTVFHLNSDGVNLTEGWSNQDTDETVYALFVPKMYNGGTGNYDIAIGSVFSWNGGSATYQGGETDVKVPVTALDSLKFTAPPGAAGQFEIDVKALSRDVDEDDPSVVVEKISEPVSQLTNLIVNPVPNPVTLGVSQARGLEDEVIPLDVRPQTTDPDETFNIRIGNIPGGAQILYDYGDGNGPVPVGASPGGYVQIDNYEPGNLYVQPPSQSNDDFELSIKSQVVDKATTEGGEITQESDFDTAVPRDLFVQVQGVADDAALVVDSSHEEAEALMDQGGGGMSLNRVITSITLSDQDGSESATLIISGLEDGFMVQGGSFVGGTGTNRQWMVSADSLADGSAKVVVPQNFNGKVDFNAKVVTTESDGDANPDASGNAPTPVSFTVTPSPEAEMHTSVSGDEDTWVKMDFGTIHKNGDTDEVVSKVLISQTDIDGKGLVLNIGDGAANPLTAVGGYYEVNQSDIDNIFIKGAPNATTGNGDPDGQFTFEVKYTVTDPGKDGVADGSIENTTQYTLSLAPITDETDTAIDTGSFSSTGGAASFDALTKTVTVTGEDTFSLGVDVSQQADANASTPGPDTDGSEQLQYFIVDGVPAGVSIDGGSYMGHNPGGGAGDFTSRWMVPVSEADGAFNTQTLTQNLSFTIDNSKGIFDEDSSHEITVTAYSKDGPDELVAESADTFTLEIQAMAGGGGTTVPAMVSASGKDFDMTEDAQVALSDMVNFSLDTSDPNVDPNPKFSITLSGLPEGCVVEGMTKTTSGGETIWTASGIGNQTDLDNMLEHISITPPDDWNANNHDGQFHFDAAITSYTDAGEQQFAAVGGVAPSEFTPATDVYDMDLTSAEVVNEGGSVPITIDLSNDADDSHAVVVDGKVYVQIDEPGMGTGGTLTHNGETLTTESVNGIAGIPNGEYYVINGIDTSATGGNAQLNLTYTPEAHASGSFKVRSYVESHEENAPGNDNMVSAASEQTFEVTPLNSGYDVAVAAATGNEDENIVLQIGGTGLLDKDGSESAVSATLQGIPEGYIVFAGPDASSPMANNIGDGKWELPLDDEGKLPEYIAVKAPENVSGTTGNIKLTVFSGEAGQCPTLDESTFDLTIVPVADGVTIEPNSSVGLANQDTSLNLNPTMLDTDGSEVATVKITGLQLVEGDITFNTGSSGTVTYDQESDTYTIAGVENEDLGSLSFNTQYNVDKNVTIEAYTTEEANGDVSAPVTAENVHILVNGGETAPEFPDDGGNPPPIPPGAPGAPGAAPIAPGSFEGDGQEPLLAGFDSEVEDQGKGAQEIGTDLGEPQEAEGEFEEVVSGLEAEPLEAEASEGSGSGSGSGDVDVEGAEESLLSDSVELPDLGGETESAATPQAEAETATFAGENGTLEGDDVLVVEDVLDVNSDLDIPILDGGTSASEPEPVILDPLAEVVIHQELEDQLT